MLRTRQMENLKLVYGLKKKKNIYIYIYIHNYINQDIFLECKT